MTRSDSEGRVKTRSLGGLNRARRGRPLGATIRTSRARCPESARAGHCDASRAVARDSRPTSRSVLLPCCRRRIAGEGQLAPSARRRQVAAAADRRPYTAPKPLCRPAAAARRHRAPSNRGTEGRGAGRGYDRAAPSSAPPIASGPPGAMWPGPARPGWMHQATACVFRRKRVSSPGFGAPQEARRGTRRTFWQDVF